MKKTIQLIICILIPVGLGFIVGLITKDFNNYTELVKPIFAPPAFIFPIVWTILYILMGISCYLIIQKKSIYQKQAMTIYVVQLVVNLLWSIIFFVFKWYLFSIAWILILLFLVIAMISKFYPISKLAAYLQIPYYLWLLLAIVLNIAIFVLN